MDKNVILFSGGMDSFCMMKLHNHDTLLTFDLGTKDNRKELQQIQKMIDHDIINSDKLEVVSLPLSRFELPNKIVPHRNSLMCLIASNFGNRIYVGATAGDTTKDKDHVFKSQVEGLLNYFALDQHKVTHPNYPYTVEMPFKHLTKVQIVATYLEKGGSASDLLEYSRSCYNDSTKECGKCRSCLRKIVALELNDLPYEKYFQYNPLEHDLPEVDIQKMKSRVGEYKEYLAAKAKHVLR